jgi:hypothetical protein
MSMLFAPSLRADDLQELCEAEQVILSFSQGEATWILDLAGHHVHRFTLLGDRSADFARRQDAGGRAAEAKKYRGGGLRFIGRKSTFRIPACERGLEAVSNYHTVRTVKTLPWGSL